MLSCMATKQQFNVALPPELIRRVKHHSIDVQLSLSDLVTHVLEAHLAGKEADMTDLPPPTGPGTTNTRVGTLQLQPMVHVKDMTAAVNFYEQLGGQLLHGSRDGDWVLMHLAGAEVGLLAHPPNPEQNEGLVELNFSFTGRLDALEEQLREAGVTIAQPTTDEGFGRQLQLSSPDGVLVKVNELQPELYT